MDKQLAKLKTSDGDLYRIRWYGYGGGVRTVLEKHDGTEWVEQERRDEGSGSPGSTPIKEYKLNQKETEMLGHMEDKLKDIYEKNIEERVEGIEIRKK